MAVTKCVTLTDSGGKPRHMAGVTTPRHERPRLRHGRLLACLFCAAAVALPAGADAQPFELGGRLMWDADSFDGVLNRPGGGARRFDGYLRRARLEIGGEVGDDVEYVFDVDFTGLQNAAATATLHTAGLRYTGLDAFELFVGRTKEPFGLEELTSSNAISAIERNFFTEATDSDSQPNFGVRLDGAVGRVGWQTGLFNPRGSPSRRDGGDRFAWTSRVFAAPVLDGDHRVVHVGAAYSDRRLDAPVLQAGFGLDVAEGGGQLDSSTLLVEDDRELGLEGLVIRGPFSLQAELFRKLMEGAAGGPDADVDAYYLQGTWTLTGQARGYRPREGVAGAVDARSGRAIELVARYDTVRFAVDGRPDERAEGWLLGANWYLNSNLRFMLDYVHLESEGVAAPGAAGDADVLSTRIQLAF